MNSYERIIIVVLILGAGVYGLDKYLSHDADVKKAAATQADQARQAAEQKVDELTKLVTAQSQQYQNLANTLAIQNKSLIDSIIARNTSAEAQQKTDANLQPSELATRWEAVANLKVGDVSSQTDGFKVTPPAALTTVQQLELVPALSADLKDGKDVLSNKDTQIASLTDLNSTLVKQMAACKDEQTAADTACKKEIASLNAQARKGKFWWFLRGAAAGAGFLAYLLK